MTQRRITGFSLVELVTVLALLSVVSTLGTVAFFRVDGRWHADYTRNRLYHAAETVFNEIRADVGRLLAPEIAGAPVRGVTSTYIDAREGSRFWHAGFEDDLLVFPMVSMNPATDLPERHSLMYRIERRNGTNTLVRQFGAPEEEVPSGATMALHGSDVETLSLCVEYFDGQSWRRGWNRPGAPEALRISLVLMDKNRFYEQIAQSAVFAVHVR